jgi:hypothetical protein
MSVVLIGSGRRSIADRIVMLRRVAASTTRSTEVLLQRSPSARPTGQLPHVVVGIVGDEAAGNHV